jgi:nucleoside-diphosphate-sugar epimerase
MSSRVSVLGCGWLGLDLAKALVNEGYNVNGSTQSTRNFVDLEAEQIAPFKLSISNSTVVSPEIETFLNVDTLIITLPFKRSFAPASLYLDQFNALIPYICASPISKLLFTSSTLIYPQIDEVFEESTNIKQFSDRSKVLFDVENVLLNLTGIDTTICRLGGLYGYDRKLGNFLNRNSNRLIVNNTVNLIHRDDIISAIKLLLKHKTLIPILNFVSDKHPTRKELYTKKANLLGVALPQFDEDASIISKIVSNKLLKSQLNFTFTHKDPLND